MEAGLIEECIQVTNSSRVIPLIVHHWTKQHGFWTGKRAEKLKLVIPNQQKPRQIPKVINPTVWLSPSPVSPSNLLGDWKKKACIETVTATCDAKVFGSDNRLWPQRVTGCKVWCYEDQRILVWLAGESVLRLWTNISTVPQKPTRWLDKFQLEINIMDDIASLLARVAFSDLWFWTTPNRGQKKSQRQFQKERKKTIATFRVAFTCNFIRLYFRIREQLLTQKKGHQPVSIGNEVVFSNLTVWCLSTLLAGLPFLLQKEWKQMNENGLKVRTSKAVT